ncbi:hypothetical protein [Clostridium coskatii]|uniref:SprT-like family protein n=1 Tax=Clostridium coskatii TaxID=1705578 RepID=A0A170NL44_9CLOT|nr:hypothetical protein [Clostridium coskatii]OAA91321.1 hypothetical protein WX73_01731 [Clostridium coskatii]OBR93953.1 hypothetical protein CLCOS_20890 [Clostridium coskatii]
MDGIKDQLLLDKLLKQVYKTLKKKMFPRKHIKLLHGDVDIAIKEMDSIVMGCYENEPVGNYRYKHHIFINLEIIKDYTESNWGKRYFKQRIKDTIAHELIHAYVFEEYEGFCDIENTYLDGSPIFLSILAYLNLPSGYKSWKSFIRTDLYKKIKQCNTFEKVEHMLFRTVLAYEKKFRELERIVDNNKKILVANFFEFANGYTTGVKGYSTVTFNDNGFLCKSNSFQIGAYTDISKLNALIKKKIVNNSFEYKFCGKFECNTTEDKRSKLHLQSMNI